MDIHIAFDPLHLIGIVFCAYFASLVGNVAGAIVAGIFGSFRGEQGLKLLVLIQAMFTMWPVKVFIAFVATCVAMYACATTSIAWLTAMAISAIIGFLFTALASITTRV